MATEDQARKTIDSMVKDRIEHEARTERVTGCPPNVREAEKWARRVEQKRK